MSSPALPIDTLPHRVGVGAIRRYAATVLGRGTPGADAVLRLRGSLPLRFPGDALGLEHDPLTGLATQPVFVTALRRFVESSARAKAPCSLVLIDVDELADVNRRRGYVVGDQVLRRVAAVIQRGTLPGDRAFRIGGDEFAVLMAGTGADEAHRRASAILGALMDPDDDAPAVSFSAGVSAAPADASDYDALYRRSLAAMVDVKRSGRAGVAAFDPRRHASSEPAPSTGLELVERVISGRLLRPVFQPIVDLRDGHAVGFEGLVRVVDGERALRTTDLFAAADAADRVAELDLACIDVVVAGARSIRPDRLITLNLSPRTLGGHAFEPGWLLERLVRAGISPSRVVVELSDDGTVVDLRHLQTTFSELQRLGMRVAADDVTGDDPSRRLLPHLPFDIVKIDLARIWEGAQTGPRLAGLRDLAYSRSARVMAEGVETSEQLAAVRDLEFGAAQGYLLGRPDATAIDRVLELEELMEAERRPLDDAQPQPQARSTDSDVTVPAERLATFLPPAAGLTPDAGTV